MIQTLSLKLSRHLSSLAPGFEGHWAYVESSIDGKTQVVCAFKRYSWRWANDYKFICPAWQAEDLLRNWIQISDAQKLKRIWGHAEIISRLLYATDHGNPYQKIEEYLCSILK